MKSDIAVESKIKSFWVHKTEQYPELNQPVNRLYRDVLRQEQLDHDMYRQLAGEEQPVTSHYQPGRFSGNHFRRPHFAR